MFVCNSDHWNKDKKCSLNLLTQKGILPVIVIHVDTWVLFFSEENITLIFPALLSLNPYFTTAIEIPKLIFDTIQGVRMSVKEWM